MSEISQHKPEYDAWVTLLSALGVPINAQLAAILAQLDVALSTRASEATVIAILAQLDVALSTRASQATVASILAQLDVALSTRASEATLLVAGISLTAILAKMDNPADPMLADVTDRVGRLLGIVYGDVGQLRQNANRSLYTLEETPTAIIEGVVTLTGAAQQFPNDPCKSVTIENVSTNAVVYVGHDNTILAANGYALRSGATISLDIDNTNRIWVLGTAPQVITYIGVN